MNRLPTTGWVAGEFVTDPHILQVGSDAQDAMHTIWLGFYEPESGQRLPRVSGEGTVLGDYLELDVSQIGITK